MNTCVCCGAPVPEGRMVCPLCEIKALAMGNKEGNDESFRTPSHCQS